jgi:hypothetical protein
MGNNRISMLGYKRVQAYSAGTFTHGRGADKKTARYPERLDMVAIGEPRTFGAALDRAMGRH